MVINHHFDQDVLKVDPEKEVTRITNGIRHILRKQLKRRGLVVALSGGIDSSVTAALAVRALGSNKVCILLMPERHSSANTLGLSHQVSSMLKVKPIEENISKILEAVGFYKKYDDAVRLTIPDYGDGWKSKIVISSDNSSASRFSLFSIVAQHPEGKKVTRMLPMKAYLEIVAATNFKQRVRKMLEYYHADRLNFAVAGTPNRLEYDQGFFVKLGDGAADIKPIAHLYKSQVYQLAEYLGIPESVRCRLPTTDTYSLEQSQEEFFFTIPLGKMDLCLYAHNHEISPNTVSEKIGMPKNIVERVYREIEQKRRTTRYLHLSGQLIEDVTEIQKT